MNPKPATGTRIAKHSVMVHGHPTSVSLEDAFWQALKEIAGAQGRPVATLIAEISATTDSQAKAATKVANSMGDILRITEQASEGTKRTAGSIGKLSELARALKESVSNFKIG